MSLETKKLVWFIEFDDVWAYVGPDITALEAHIKESLEVDDEDGCECKAKYMSEKEISELKEL